MSGTVSLKLTLRSLRFREAASREGLRSRISLYMLASSVAYEVTREGVMGATKTIARDEEGGERGERGERVVRQNGGDPAGLRIFRAFFRNDNLSS